MNFVNRKTSIKNIMLERSYIYVTEKRSDETKRDSEIKNESKIYKIMLILPQVGTEIVPTLLDILVPVLKKVFY